MYIDTHHSLSQLASSLLPLPPTSQSYLLSLYTLTLERDALLSQAEMHADYRQQSCERQHELEKEQLETEYVKARNGVKATLLDRIEERRKRCREERDALDVVGEFCRLRALSGLPPGMRAPFGRGVRRAPVGAPTTVVTTGADTTALLISSDSHAFPAIPAGPLLQLPSTLANAVGTPSLSGANGTASRSLRQSRHTRGPSYRSSTPGGLPSVGGPSGSNGIAGPSSGGAGTSNGEQGDGVRGPLSILSDEIFAPSAALSLSILNHPSLSKNSLAANLFSFASSASGPSSKKARHHASNPGGGGETGPTLPGQGIFDRPAPDSSKDDRMFVYTPGKSLADLGKVVKGSELEIDWDLDQIRRTWKGGVLMGNVRGRRGAAVRAEALTAAGAGR